MISSRSSTDYFAKALRLTRNVIVLLPITFEIREIAAVLQCFKREAHFKTFIVEIEQISIN